MSTTLLARRACIRAFAVVLVVGGPAVVAPARAATGPVAYSCTSPAGDFGLVGDVDSDLPPPPAKITALDTRRSTWATMEGVLPAGLVTTLHSAGYRSISGAFRFQGDIDGRVKPFEVYARATSLGDGTQAVGVAAGGSLFYDAMKVGTSTFSTGDFTAELLLDREDGSEPQPLTAVCEAPPGPPPVIDTVIVMSRSSTVLTLDKDHSAHGDAVTASAQVTTTVGSPAGEVLFHVDAVPTARVQLDKDGIARLVLDRLAVGTHRVNAWFVPADPQHYFESWGVLTSFEVSRVGSVTKVAVAGQRTREVTRARARVAGIFGTVPHGRVKFVLRKFGDKQFKKVKLRVLEDGAGSAGLGRLGRGVYKLRVVYKGDSNHLPSKQVLVFRERRP